MAKPATPRKSSSQELSRAEHEVPTASGNGPRHPSVSLLLTALVRPRLPAPCGHSDSGSADLGFRHIATSFPARSGFGL